MKAAKSTPWINHPRFLKILYPTLVAVLVIFLWQGAVSYFRIPQFLVPSPLVMVESLWTHLTPLLLSLLFTLKITLISISPVDRHRHRHCVLSWCRNRFVETALFPYIVLPAGNANCRHRAADHYLGKRRHPLTGGVLNPDGGLPDYL